MYQKAFHWVHAAFADGPGQSLTVVQVGRACGVDAAVCAEVLQDLVRARILIRTEDGAYKLARADVARADPGVATGQRRASA